MPVWPWRVTISVAPPWPVPSALMLITVLPPFSLAKTKSLMLSCNGSKFCRTCEKSMTSPSLWLKSAIVSPASAMASKMNVSAPDPPNNTSEPSPPVIRSSPSWPKIRSSPAPPFRTSLPPALGLPLLSNVSAPSSSAWVRIYSSVSARSQSCVEPSPFSRRSKTSQPLPHRRGCRTREPACTASCETCVPPA